MNLELDVIGFKEKKDIAIYAEVSSNGVWGRAEC